LDCCPVATFGLWKSNMTHYQPAKALTQPIGALAEFGRLGTWFRAVLANAKPAEDSAGFQA
jgi:hypothetical protein